MPIATTLLGAMLVLAAGEPGRGGDLSGAGGTLVVIGIALLGVLIAVAAVFLVLRQVRARREGEHEARTVRAPLPSEEGRPWSSER